MPSSSRRSILLALLLSACGSEEPTAAGSASYLRADIQGAATVSYRGTGEFWSGGRREMGYPLTFGINSRGEGALQEHSISLWRQSAGRPGAGSYPLALPDYSRAEWSAFAATYTRIGAEMVEGYVARSGSLRITESSVERVAGTFRFTAVRYCARSRGGVPRQEGSCRPSSVDPQAPTIEVSGSFVAAPARYEATWR